MRARTQSFGCFPNPNGLALGRATDGSDYVFSANGGTNDVSVIDLGRALRGDTRAEIGRIPMQVGPWGITATPNGRHIIVANGGSQRDGSAGNTISVIDVDRASAGAASAEVARIRVGTDDPIGADASTDPFRHARRPGSDRPERAREQRVDREHRAGARRQS